MELLVAVALLGTVTAMLLPATRSVDDVRREGDRRRRAVAELSNVLADLSRLPPDRLLPDADGGPAPADLTTVRAPFAAALPGATLTVDVVPIDGPDGGGSGLRAVRLDGALSWTTDAGTAARPVRLSAWAFSSPVPANDDGASNDDGGTDE